MSTADTVLVEQITGATCTLCLVGRHEEPIAAPCNCLCHQREDTLVSIRLVNAQRDVLGALDLLLRARRAAEAAGKSELADEIEGIYCQQQAVAARLIVLTEGIQ